MVNNNGGTEVSKGMIKVDIDGFLRNSTKDYTKFREKLDELLADADDDEREEFLSEADEIHDNLVFLADIVKHPANDPDEAELRGIRKGLEAAAKAMEQEHDGVTLSDCIRTLSPEAILKGGE